MKKFKSFDSQPLIHGISTRKDGVSQGLYASMNTSFSGGDDPKLVFKNIKIALSTLGANAKIILACEQIHSDAIEIVTEETDFSKFERVVTKGTALEGYDFYFLNGVDGAVTNRKDVILMTFYADCVPLLAYDKKQHVVANVHSGWRGTSMGLARKMIQAMSTNFASNVEDVSCAIGQSAGFCCYEVDQSVFDSLETQFEKKDTEAIFLKKPDGKYMLDLKKANLILFQSAGIQSSNIEVSSECTICAPDLFHSHRASAGKKRGSMSAFTQLL